MNEIVTFLEKSKLQYLATLGLDGKPKVRPFQFMFVHEGKIWYCTSNTKDVFKELEKQPFVEFCASDATGMKWMRMSGKVIFEDNIAVKEKVLAHSSLVKKIYGEASNPVFEVFYLSEVSAAISEIGKAPTIITL